MLYYRTLNEKTQMYDKYLEGQVYNFLDKTFVIPQDFEFNLFTVEDQYVMRPDLISKDAYGDSMYADIICKLNGVNPFELNSGMVLILPQPFDILRFTNVIDQSQREIDTEYNVSNLPTPKVKNTKRKANEAVISDKRFNIDPVRGVIIY